MGSSFTPHIDPDGVLERCQIWPDDVEENLAFMDKLPFLTESENVSKDARQKFELISPTGWFAPILKDQDECESDDTSAMTDLTSEDIRQAWEQHRLGIKELEHQRIGEPSRYMLSNVDVPRMRQAKAVSQGPVNRWTDFEDYQKDGIGLLLAGERGERGSVRGSLMADDTGLDIFPQIFALIDTHRITEPTLIIASRERIQQWQKKLEEWLGLEVKSLFLDGTIDSMTNSTEGNDSTEDGGLEDHRWASYSMPCGEDGVQSTMDVDSVLSEVDSPMPADSVQFQSATERGCMKEKVTQEENLIANPFKAYEIVFATYERVGAQFGGLENFMKDMAHRRRFPYPHPKSRVDKQYPHGKDLCFRRPRASLFRIEWGRVILDDSQTIENPDTDVAKGCCHLRSQLRLSIHSRPLIEFGEIFSQLKFLRVQPYCRQSVFQGLLLQVPPEGCDELDLRPFAMLFVALLPETIHRRIADHFKGREFLETAQIVRRTIPVDLQRGTAHSWIYKGVSTSDAVTEGYNYSRGTLLRVKDFFKCSNGIDDIRDSDALRFDIDAEKYWPENEMESQYFTRHIWCHRLRDAVVRVAGEVLSTPTPEAIEDAILSIVHSSIPPLRHCESSLKSYSLDQGQGFLTAIKMDRKWRSTKMSRCLQILQDAKRQRPHERWVIVSYLSRALDVIQAGLEEATFQFVRIDDRNTPNEINASLDYFNSEEEDSPFVLLLQTSIDSSSFTFKEASNVLLLTHRWDLSHEDYLQQIAACFASGSTVSIYELIAQGSIDQVIEKRGEAKRERKGGILDLCREVLPTETRSDATKWRTIERWIENMRTWKVEDFSAVLGELFTGH
ncbi:hypothetical protein L207DRAFT_638568 [Hyaloscypha variabilis F]|uniref:SNF2 N-terminal domain-containing protein n=1 Tax=Hyaloscypha variabilis (strain UAMH 11265 / GT02V1 / F) TaxID=1149755 RepID=A0A2J6R674_HYAVF|nr:hypothetical protein L207DRAFT_638568 [Hyaloscypha variabilis F]